MKKLTMCFALAAMLMAPFTAFAMDVIADSELDEVTGQAGVDISIVDFNMDLHIASKAYGDQDTGVRIASGHSITYHEGWIVCGRIEIENIYITMNGSAVYTDTTYTTKGGIAARPLTIDVETSDSTTLYYSARNKTGVVIGMPDLYISIDACEENGIYLQGTKPEVTGTFNASVEKFDFSVPSLVETNSLGSIYIGGIELMVHSSVAQAVTLAVNPRGRSAYTGIEVANQPVRFFPSHMGLLTISAH
jgi:hypothetical protein